MVKKRLKVLCSLVFASLIVVVLTLLIFNGSNTLRLEKQMSTDYATGYLYRIKVSEEYTYFGFEGTVWSNGDQIDRFNGIVAESTPFIQNNEYFIGLSCNDNYQESVQDNIYSTVLWLSNCQVPIPYCNSNNCSPTINTIVGHSKQKIVLNKPIPLVCILLTQNEVLSKTDCENILNGNTHEVSKNHDTFIVVSIIFSDSILSFPQMIQ